MYDKLKYSCFGWAK